MEVITILVGFRVGGVQKKSNLSEQMEISE